MFPKKKKLFYVALYMGFPGCSVVKNLPAYAGDVGSILGSGRPPGEENRNPLEYSCLGNPMDRGTWQVTVHGVTKESDTTERLNNNLNKLLYNKQNQESNAETVLLSNL